MTGHISYACTNDDCPEFERPEDAPELDWLAWGVSDAALAELRDEDPETAAEFEAMRERYRTSRGR